VNYKQMMRWQKKHPRGGKAQYMGFHSGMFAPQNPPTEGTKEWFAKEILIRYKTCVRCWRERRDYSLSRIRDIFRENRKAMKELSEKMEAAA